ncbi:MAG: S4 domain-containing protein, partial [Thermomicrobium sp.]|nr:S4 domain-containing protein [Thermomicrobium sp.]
AREYFHRVHRLREVPEELPEVPVPPRARVIDFIVRAGFARSNNEARRLIMQGGVRLDGERLDDPEAVMELFGPAILQVGKRRFARLLPSAQDS